MQPRVLDASLQRRVVQFHGLGMAAVLFVLAAELIIQVGIGWVFAQSLLQKLDTPPLRRVRVRVFCYSQQFQDPHPVLRINSLTSKLVSARRKPGYVAE